MKRRATNGDGDVPAQVSVADRATLLRKYRLLAAWRKQKDLATNTRADGERADTPRSALRDLAQEFPGALRELDVLGLAEISRRIDQLVGAAPPVTVTVTGAEPAGRNGRNTDDQWIHWILAYHGLMRAALIIKQAAGPTRRLSPAALARSLDQARAACAVPLDESFALAVIRPPGGRLTVVVLTALAGHFGTSATEISRTLFPPRRPPPYSLPS